MTKILVCGDFSQVKTGFGKYQDQLVRGLMGAGYEVAELAHSCYIDSDRLVPWKVYPCCARNTDPDYKEFQSNPTNNHGYWRWEKTVLHFKPDIVISPLDPWQLHFQATSPLKPFYHLILCTTLDSSPQKPEYLNIYSYADTLLTYTKWAQDVLEWYNLDVHGYIPFGINTNIFRPVKNKKLHKMVLGLNKDATIIGFVARNNPRKRFPELFEAFRILLDRYPNDNLYLYLHTTYPEVSWDYPSLLLEYGIYDRVLFTYKCKESKKPFPSIYKGTKALSPFTNRLTGEFITVLNGINDTDLAHIYNCMDLYVQCSSNEGFGIPLLEAAACNIPIIAPDYSAMTEITEDFNGTLLGVDTFRDYTGLNSDKAFIDSLKLADAMERELNKNITPNNAEMVEAKYSETKFIEAWIKVVENAINNPAIPWDTPFRSPQQLVINQSDSVSSRVSKLNAHFHSAWDYSALHKIRDVNRGVLVKARATRQYTINNLVDELNNKHTAFIKAEELRTGMAPLTEEYWMKNHYKAPK